MVYSRAMDILAIDDLAIECILGDDPEERLRPRPVRVSVELSTDFSAAARSDSLADAIDYRALAGRLARVAVEGRFRLVEALARALLAVCLDDPRVSAARVAVTKPGVPPGAAAARAVSEMRKA